MRANGLAVKNTIMDYRGPRRLYLYLRRANGRRVMLFLSACFLLAVLLGLMGYYFVQELVTYGNVFPGVSIVGNAVGGMSRSEATDVVQKSVETPLAIPMVLTEDEDTYTLDLTSIGMTVDVKGMVDAAFDTSHGENILARMYRRFMNRPLHVDVPVKLRYDKAQLEAFVTGIADAVNVPSRSAYLDLSKGYPVVSDSKYGFRVKQEDTVKAIESALPTRKRKLPIITESVRPETTEEDFGYIIVIRQASHELFLYKGEELIDTFAVAVGSDKYPTPNGVFSIVKKEKNPTWYPPKSEWAKDKKPIPPGPGNPLGPYWLGIGTDIGIHSTPDEKSLGYSVSHGCIRVSEWAAMYLFDHVEVGTPVYIYPK